MSQTIVKGMRSDGIIPKQDIIINVRIEFILRAVGMMIDKFTFRCIKISLHRSIVVGTVCTAHALGYVQSSKRYFLSQYPIPFSEMWEAE